MNLSLFVLVDFEFPTDSHSLCSLKAMNLLATRNKYIYKSRVGLNSDSHFFSLVIQQTLVECRVGPGFVAPKSYIKNRNLLKVLDSVQMRRPEVILFFTDFMVDLLFTPHRV